MQRIDINLKPSRVFILLICLLAVMTLAVIFSLPVVKLFKSLLCLISLNYLWFVLHKYALLGAADSIWRLSVDENGWQLHDRLRVSAAELGGESTVTAFVSILRFKIAGQKSKRSCIIFNDALAGDRYRQLLATIHAMSISLSKPDATKSASSESSH